MKRISFVSWMGRKAVQRWILGLAAGFLAVVLIVLTLEGGAGQPYWFVMLGVAVPLAAWAALRATALILANPTTGVLVPRVLLSYALVLLIFGLLYGVDLVRIGGYWPFEETERTYAILVAVLAVPAMFAYLLLVVLLFLTVPLLCLYAASLLVAALEFLVRRIAEYPKGPILAASALVAAVISILKLFT
jgi:hypothetical protein